MNSKELQRKLKVERVEVCLNCTLFTDCNNIGQFVECEEFVEVDSEKAMVIVRLDEYSKLESNK
jgi:hypothetical protein